MNDRLIDSELKPEDIFDKSIRPESLDEYVVKKKLKKI